MKKFERKKRIKMIRKLLDRINGNLGKIEDRLRSKEADQEKAA